MRQSVMEIVDMGEGEVSNRAVLSWLLIRVNRRLWEATDDETQRVYNRRSTVLGEALRWIDGPSDIPPWRRQTILKDFAKLSPRSESPTNRLTTEGIFDATRECEVTLRGHNSSGLGTTPMTGVAGSSGDVTNPGSDAAMPMDETAPMAVNEVDGDEIDEEENPVYGPQTLDDRNLHDIHRMRRDALNELYGRLAQAQDYGEWQRVALIEAQIDWWSICI